MKPQKLKEVFQDFDASSPTVAINISQQGICISTNGEMGKIRVGVLEKKNRIKTAIFFFYLRFHL